jgi:hypothetical protein
MSHLMTIREVEETLSAYLTYQVRERVCVSYRWILENDNTVRQVVYGIAATNLPANKDFEISFSEAIVGVDKNGRKKIKIKAAIKEKEESDEPS